MASRSKSLWCSLLAFVLVAFSAFSTAQDFSKVQIQTIKVADGVYMLVGSGGNIGVSAGEDGILMIDTQFAEIIEKIKSAIAEISSGQIRFVLNTNWHYDHAYGNEPLGKSGALIIAHENTRMRMTSEQNYPDFDMKMPALPEAALPVLTFTDSLTLHFNGEEIQVTHIEKAHSDADIVIYFRKANVIHTGDLYFTVLYPYIDVSHGGSIDGMIAAAERISSMIDENTKIIPGHGPLSNLEELKTYRDMLVTIRDRIKKQIKEGKTLEEVLASKPTADFDKEKSSAIPPEMFVQIIYNDLAKK
ncbi:MAG: MBL fold metallo-hydrolase [Candidatus Aminicenantes bacterium]|nr:MAG: MBL fold metallo-hydrolase [Candidatus Aminicenantes bacterium]